MAEGLFFSSARRGGKKAVSKVGDKADGRVGTVILTEPDDAPVSGKAYGELFGIKYSPLSRKIVTFNLVALCLMMTGILYFNQIDDDLVRIREKSLETDARFISEMLSLRAASIADADGTVRDATVKLFDRLASTSDSYAQLYDAAGDLVAHSKLKAPGSGANGEADRQDPSGIVSEVSTRIARFFFADNRPPPTVEERSAFTEESTRSALMGNLRRARENNSRGEMTITVALPVVQDGVVRGAVVLSTEPGEIDALVREERLQILRIFFLAMVINVILSLALANTIAHPLQELAEAAERGGATNTTRLNPERIEIPNVTGRPDEIGYLASAMKSMTTALYDRIEANESFAADVAHEIKNPLTSLRSAVDTMKYARDEAGREKLLKVIQQDVNRLDRLVTDISNASRLDGELVRDEMQPFDLNSLLTNLVDYNQDGAQAKGAALVSDLASGKVMVSGLEGRLAQVFVNLITNAISFSEDGDKITVLTERVGNTRVRIKVEDTGPGIPDENLEDVFSRFYSNRPGQEFGNHSGLGLAISKQIVDAHGGSIHAENIRPKGAGSNVPPDGARFTVELPV